MSRRAALSGIALALSATLAGAADAPKDVAGAIEATDSDFRPCLAVGANNDAREHPEVRGTIDGAPSETDVDKQASILGSPVVEEVPGILVAASSSDAPAPCSRRRGRTASRS